MVLMKRSIRISLIAVVMLAAAAAVAQSEDQPVRNETPPGSSEVTFQLRFLYDPDGRLAGEHPEIPHVLEAARKAEEEGGEAPPSALKDLR